MRIDVMSCLLLSGVLAAASDTNARTTIYKSVMPDGRVIYGEQPQTGARTVEKSVVNVDDTGVQPVSREVVEGASQRALERTQILDNAFRTVQVAEVELHAAESAREIGREPLPGERIGIVGPGTRLTEEYFQRQQMLEERVGNARKHLENAQRSYANIR